MSKFGDDIRRIARYQELLDLIRQNKPVNPDAKAPIDGGRGISYGKYSSKKGSPGETTPDNDGVDTDDAQEKDGTPDDGTDNKPPINDPTSIVEAGTTAALDSLDNSARNGWYDLDSLLQAAKDSFGKNPPTNNNRINSITGIETDAGRLLIAHLKSAESSFIGPDTIPDGETAWYNEPDPDWVAGFYYTASNFAGTAEGETFNRAGANMADAMIGFNLPAVPGYYVSQVDYVSSTINPTTGNGDYTVEYYYTNGTLTNGPVTNNIAVVRHSCTSVGVPSTSCVATAPGITWSQLGATQLAWVSKMAPTLIDVALEKVGRFIPHPSDVDVPIEFLDGASILDVVTASGSDARIGPTADGGWYAYYSDGSGNPAGDANTPSVYKVNADRTPGGYVTPNMLTKMLPAE